MKGDLSGMAMPGNAQQRAHDAFTARAAEIGLTDWSYADNPVVFWDLFGEQGHPIRTTVSEMGPLLLARLLGLNETQEGVLTIAFRAADDEGMLLLNLDDLRSMLTWVAENAAELTTRYGNVAKPIGRHDPAPVARLRGAGRRPLLRRARAGDRRLPGDRRSGPRHRQHPRRRQADAEPQALRDLPACGCCRSCSRSCPRSATRTSRSLVFFFDEAHLLFEDAPAALLEKIEQVVRLIRSKGVGVYFVTQNPLDIPEAVAAQLGNRVQHALRAFTPKDQRAVQGRRGDVPDQSRRSTSRPRSPS